MCFSAHGEEANLEQWEEVLADVSAETLSRLEAAEKLAEAKDSKYIGLLTETLKDDNKAVRWAALEALWQINDRKALPSLVQYLQKEEAYTWGKILTMNALGSLKDPEAVNPLLAMLESENPFLRRSAALNLVRIGDDKAIPGLIRLLKDREPWVGRMAHDFLLQMTEGKIDEPPIDYEEWIQWYAGSGEGTNSMTQKE